MTEGHYAVRAEDFDRLVAERDEARAEADRLREALVRVGYSVAGAHPEAMRKIARTALNAEEEDTR